MKAIFRLTASLLFSAFQVSYAQTVPSQWKVEFISINSLSNDYGPAFFKDGLIFSSDRNPGLAIKRVDKKTKTPFSTLYTVDFRSTIQPMDPGQFYKRNSGLVAPDFSAKTGNDSKSLAQYASQKTPDSLQIASEKITPVRMMSTLLQTKYNDGPLVHSPISGDFYITRNNQRNDMPVKGSNGKNNLQLYIVKNLAGQNFYFRKFPHNSDDFSTMHPAISENEELLIFASDAPGGFGGADLYYCTKAAAGWSKPVNMGGTVNSPGNELFPFIDKKGNLYFSSDGHGGKGKLDIFFAELTNNVVSRIENMPYPINTEHDDTGFIISGTTGYLASDRLGSDDIYRVTKQNQK